MLTLNDGVMKYVFPNFMLNTSSMVTIHTHMNPNIATDLFGSNFIWTVSSDVELIDRNGLLVSEYTLPP